MNTKLSKAQQIADRVIGQLDTTYDLVYIDYNDNLPDDVLKAYVNEGVTVATDLFYDTNSDWLADQEADSVTVIIHDLTTDQEYDILQDNYEQYEGIRDAIYDRDTSTPFDDLLRNASKQWLVYDLGLELDAPELVMVNTEKYPRGVAQATELQPKLIAKHLNLNYKAHKDILRELVENASYGGQLQLLMHDNVNAFDGLQEGKQYTFNNIELAIIDYMNGSGHDVTIDSLTITWHKTNLSMNDFYANDVCGLYAPAFEGFTVNIKKDKE